MTTVTTTIEPGDGATVLYPSDRYGLVVTRVSPSGKTIWVRQLRTVDHATGHEPHHYAGPWPVWDHTYTDEERQTMAYGDERAVRRTKRGWSMNGTPIAVGAARYRRDYSE